MPAADRTTEPTRGPKTIGIPCSQEQYQRIVDDPVLFREFLDQQIEATPELFPPEIHRGYRMKDLSTSRKTGWRLRRIDLRNGQSYSVRPSFLMPYLSGRTEDVQAPLVLRKFAVPFWALAEVFGRDPMYWHRLECALGRFSLVGTTVQAAEHLPRHLVADEKHTTRGGEKVYLAATAGSGCCLGLAVAETAGNDHLEAAYGVFRDEARRLDPEYRPETVNTDGGPATQAAWQALFKGVTIILCFLHAFLKIRDRAQHLKETFHALSEQVWGAYHAPNARSFSQRLRRLREWAEAHVDKEVVREKVLSLCDKREAFLKAYAHPGCRRTSDLVDRLLRRLDYHLYCGQHLHGSTGTAGRGLRGWALIHNFAPSCPWTVRTSPELRSPAERLNGKRYHTEWLQNLLVSASLGGYRRAPQKAG
jgi:hypothetical protein